MTADSDNIIDGEVLTASTVNVIPFRGQTAEQDEPESEQSRARGPELTTMRQILREQTKVYRQVRRKELSSSEGERMTKILATLFSELQFLDFEKGIAERLAALEESRGMLE